MIEALKEYYSLLWLNLLVKKRLIVEYLRVISRYYSNSLFRSADLSLLRRYLFQSPFTISKKFLRGKGDEDIYTYGETPLTTLDLISKECDISSADRVFELGCGRGRCCFWLRCMIGCKAVGIEYIPEFVAAANAVKKEKALQGVEFRLEDILEADYSGATLLYLYGTCYDELFLKKLIKRLSRLPPNTRIITVSYSLNEFTKEPLFEVIKHFDAPFTWGNGEVYVQRRR